MFVYTITVLLFISSIDAAEQRSGFVEEYFNTNYIPLISQTRYVATKQVESKSFCLFDCLNVDDCSMIVYNLTNCQCTFYNIFPIVVQELLFENNIITCVFQRTIQFPTSISDTNWLTSRLNTTTPTNVISLQNPRCLVIDTFGYLLTLETVSGTTFINRYDRTNLGLIQHTALQMQYTTLGMLSYFNGMVFISSYLNNISVFDHVNFNLLGVINCGSSLGQPRDIIFIENQKMMIIASQTTNTLFFVRFYSPTNYTCLNSTSLPGGPQALLKINETFFHATTWSSKCIYSYYFNGQVWVPSLFANVTQTLGTSSINVGHLQIDNLQRRWVTVISFGLVIYDKLETFLGKWKLGNKPFDIYFSSDYRLIVSDYGNSILTLYDPQISE